MQAIRVRQFGNPEVLQVETVFDLNPTDNQVLIDVKAIGINPVDTYIRSGVYAASPELPYTPGADAAGVVAAIGSGVTQHKIGDRVYCHGSISGCYAEQVLCQEQRVYPLPDNVPFNAGAALGVPYSTAYFALYYRAHAMPGETLLIHGASGTVGLAALQLAKNSGISAIGTAGSQAGLELIRKQGAIAALDHTTEGYLDSIRELTDGQDVNVVLEMLANVNLQQDLDLLAQQGRVVVIGNRGTIEINPRAVMAKNASILGMLLFNATDPQLQSIQAALYAGLENGTLKPIIRTELPLSDAAQAHELVLQPGAAGKIILVPYT